MDRSFMIVIIAVVAILGSSFIANTYLERKDNNIMATTGLEQCPKTPDWRNSGSIWVKDCDKYMKSWKTITVED